jgi:hypothetical protein
MRVRARARQRGVELPLVVSDHADWPELIDTIAATGAPEVWITHGREALVHALTTRADRQGPVAHRFRGWGLTGGALAELRHRLVYSGSRNARCVAEDYFPHHPDPDRAALAVLTDGLPLRSPTAASSPSSSRPSSIGAAPPVARLYGDSARPWRCSGRHRPGATTSPRRRSPRSPPRCGDHPKNAALIRGWPDGLDSGPLPSSSS